MLNQIILSLFPILT